MALTGPPDGPPRLAPGPLASCAHGAFRALRAVAGDGSASDLDAPALLGERAALLGLTRHGTVSAGGSCRLLRAADGWVAVSLTRPDDLALLPAWLGEGERRDPWDFVAARAAAAPSAELVERARRLGLAAAAASAPDPSPPPWLRVAARGQRAAQRRARPLVVDLSSLWAGPLCTHLLALAGARVVKVESVRRPDGTRSGPRPFFDLLHAEKESVALDFGTEGGRSALRELVQRADIVVESSRPRALAQLGVDAESLVENVPGLTWVSITGYGRAEPEGAWAAYGDDAGAAAGLAVATGLPGGPPMFCGDAIPDPLTGLHAAVAALASFRAGGSRLLDLALRDVTAHGLAFARHSSDARVCRSASGWEVVADGERAAVAPPRARTPRGSARPLGADTAHVLEEFGVPC
jgi:hypothetical protein